MVIALLVVPIMVLWWHHKQVCVTGNAMVAALRLESKVRYYFFTLANFF